MIKILVLLLAMTINIEYKLPGRLPHQKAFQQSNARGRALVTGYGGGKTYINAQETVKHSIIDNKIPHMMVSPSFPQAKKTIIPATHEVLQDCYGLVEGRDYKFNKSDHEFRINKWNGLIWVGSGNNPDSLNGPNLGSFSIDEPGQQRKSVYTKMLARLRHPKAKKLQWWLTGTPEGLNWFYDVCEGDEIPKNFALFRGKTTDNIHLPQSFIDDLYDQYDELLVDAYIKGLFVNMTSGSAYHSYSDDESIIDSYTPVVNRPLLIGQDFNYDPMCTIVAQERVVNNRVEVVVFDEFFLKNADTDAAFERVLEKYGSGYSYDVYPDPACNNDSAHGTAKNDITLIRNAFERYHISPGNGYTIIADRAHPKRKDRLNSVNKMLRNANKIRRLKIVKKCKYLRNDLRKCTKEEFLNGRFKDEMLGHITDALGYMIHKRYPVKVARSYRPKLVA